MEDVEKRRQRLAAMRQQAASQIDNELATPSASSPLHPPSLSDPFETLATMNTSAGAEVKASGFGFYTDPVSGFSSSKRRRPGSSAVHATHSTHSTPSSPSPHSQPSFSVPSNLYPGFSPPHLKSPLYAPPPDQGWQPIPYQPPVPPFMPGFSHPQPPQFYPQPPGHPLNRFHNQSFSQGQGRAVLGRDGWRGSPSHLSGGGIYGGRGYPPSSPGGGRGRGRGHDYNGGNSFSGITSIGNPRGGKNDSNRNAGNGGSQGRGQSIISAREQPHLFFKKSMVEDPWQLLNAS